MSNGSNSPTHGKFGWYELLTTDTAAAKTFYSGLTGWATTEMGTPENQYTVFNVDGFGVAGMMTLPKEAGPVPAWIGYIVVDDVDGYAEKIVAAGGKLHKGPEDVPGMLRFAVMLDPQGVAFIIFASLPGMEAPPNPPAWGAKGTFSWHELCTSDPEAAFAFYSELFGWTKGYAMDMGPMGTYQIFQRNGVDIGGMMKQPPNVPAPFWNYYFTVEAATGAAETVKTTGGQVLHGPAEVPGPMYIVQGMDPQGAVFAVVSEKP